MSISSRATYGWQCSDWGLAAARLLVAAAVLFLPIAACAGGDKSVSSFKLEIPSQGARLLEVSVAEYAPPKGGPAEAVVTLATAKGPREVGRFSIFPDDPFDAGKSGQPRRFNLRIPKDLELRAGEAVTASVRLAPTSAAQKLEGWRLVVSDMRFRSDP
jgi:hypothetical protein